MKKQVFAAVLAICMTLQLCGCASAAQVETGVTPGTLANETGAAAMENAYTTDTKITAVMNDPVFGDYGRLIFPVNDGYWSGDTLGSLHLTWYSNIDPDKTVEIANYMRTHAGAGDTIFYDIYTDEEKAADPAKKNTGLSEYTENDPPNYVNVGTNDGIASWRTMESRLNALNKLGIPTEFHAYEGLRHGFGLGSGTVAEGWIQDAVDFWEDRFVTPGTSTYRDFTVDNVLHAGENGDIHYNVYIPESYDGSTPYALYFTLPGYEGLYFQGVAQNLRSENFGFEARKYHDDIIIVAPQLSDWRETSANQTIALVEYFLKHYNIDPARVYANGYSGGGETMSRVLGKRPELFTAYLHCSSQWDGDLEAVAESRTPVYLVVGREDEYYGSEPSQEAYDTLHKLYREQGLSEEEIAGLLVLDIKERSYFTGKGVNNEHGGGNLFAADKDIMGWLFSKTKRTALSGTIPEELEYIPEGYTTPASQQGKLEKLTYQTWESLSYEDHAQRLTKTAWVYLPYGYSENEPYNILYLSHGGWSNETTLMGTPDSPHAFKHIVDHAIEDGKIRPLIIVLPTYNNTSESDSGEYSLSLRLTSNFHNELLNDLIPAVESKYSTYAASTDAAGLAASRDYRAFGGFSMGSMNTWHTFEHCLDYFRYFAPSSGGPIGGGEAMADIVRNSGHSPEDFFLFTASGTEDFAYSGFKSGVMAMAETDVFTLADSETEGNLSFRDREGYTHDGTAANEYIYNALRFFWNGE